MNIEAIVAGLAERLHRVVGQVYDTPPAQAEMDCAVVGFPDVTSFHSDFGHSITTLVVEVDLYVGRGEIDSAVVALSRFVSTDTPESVLAALEDKSTPVPWTRLRVESASNFRTEGDAFAVTFFLEINA